LARASTRCEVEIFTTASITRSATSAIFSGPRAKAEPENAGVSSAAAAIAASAGLRQSCLIDAKEASMAATSPK
jgi:hypothetical protein